MKSALAMNQLPDGELYRTQAGELELVVIKRSGYIGLYFQNPDGTLDGPMSRIDPQQPLFLVSEYTQALVLSLLWRPAASQIAVIGLGGGRLSMILGHYLPNAIIESVDIDPALVLVAERFFGFTASDRQRVAISDGRAFLAASNTHYDILILDAFSDQTNNLDHLATIEFYQICRQHLAQNGVVALNLLRSDPFIAAKIAAFMATFPHCYIRPFKYSLVLFGTIHQRLRINQLLQRAERLAYQFIFPLMTHATQLRFLKPAEYDIPPVTPLTDLALTSPVI